MRLALLVLGGVCAGTVAHAETRSKAAPKAPEVAHTLTAVLDAQHSLAVEMAQLRDQLNAVQRSLAETQDHLRQQRDALQAILDQSLEQIKGMREEVRGLYVESGGLKGDIGQVGKQVDALDSSLGNFRLSAGIVVALVIVLQIVLVGLMLRGRG